jgi:hypothetical protein
VVSRTSGANLVSLVLASISLLFLLKFALTLGVILVNMLHLVALLISRDNSL